MAVERIHRHKAGAQEVFVVPDGVHRGHHRILLAMPGEDRHLFGRVESPSDFRFRSTVVLHNAVTVCLLHGLVEYLFHLFFGELIGVWGCFAVFLFGKETTLQVASQVFFHRFFGIFLHARVDGGVYFQSVGVNVVIRTVFLVILLAPSVQWVCFPCQRIFVILLHLPAAVIATARLAGGHHAAQVFAEVSGKALFVVHTVVFQRKGQLLQRVALFFGNVIGLAHLVEHHVASAARAFVETHRVEERRVFAHAHQRGGFFYFQFRRFATEIGVRSGFNAHGVI